MKELILKYLESNVEYFEYDNFGEFLKLKDSLGVEKNNYLQKMATDLMAIVTEENLKFYKSINGLI